MSNSPEHDLWTPHTVEETQDIYRRWAKEYDRDVLKWGYATPTRVARAFRAAGADVNQPVLDFGCGTGLSGQALAAEGFKLIDGTDISPEMLAKAKKRKLYRSIWLGEPGKCDEAQPGDYAGIVATGVVSMGAAPPETLALLV
ncbi:MAG: methyltransferase domain-containing protein, partial [Boseongicola sp. SB0662_bin_57]|nr:methyltransferase domain-containing protein [Boseongicola sp. SB0662_bin_57]